MGAVPMALIVAVALGVLLPKVLPAALAPPGDAGADTPWRRFLDLLPAPLLAALVAVTASAGHPLRPRLPVLAGVAVALAGVVAWRALRRWGRRPPGVTEESSPSPCAGHRPGA